MFRNIDIIIKLGTTRGFIMAFIRKKTIKGNDYYYKVESIREGDKVRQKVIEYLGTTPPIKIKEEKPIKKKAELGTTEKKISISDQIINIKQTLASKVSGGRTTIEDGLLITKEKYSDVYRVYHPSYIRGGNVSTDVKSDEGLKKILIRTRKYMDSKKELESKGYKQIRGAEWFLKDSKGKTVRDKEGNIISESLYW